MTGSREGITAPQRVSAYDGRCRLGAGIANVFCAPGAAERIPPKRTEHAAIDATQTPRIGEREGANDALQTLGNVESRRQSERAKAAALDAAH